MESFFNWVVEQVHAVATYVQSFFVWFFDTVAHMAFEVGRFVITFFIDAVIALNVICGCGTLLNAGWAALPDITLAVGAALHVPEIIQMLLCAYAIRFVIRIAWR